MIAQADSAPLQVTGIKTANYSARSGELVQCDANGGSFTVTLPGGPRVSQIIGVKLLETTGGNAVTVSRNGNAIEGEAADPSLSEASEYLELQYNGAGTWIDRTEQETSGIAAAATTTASTTLTLDQEVVLCNNTSNITVTLPTAVGNSGKPYTLKKIGNNTATVTIDAAGSETIDGATTLLLYIRYDSVAIISDGSNWYISQDGRQPHAALVYRSSNQSIANGAEVRVNFNAAIYDRGGIADTTSDGRIEIRRAGVYTIMGYFGVENTNSIFTQCRISVNGTERTIGMLTSVTALYHRNLVHGTLFLNAGDYVNLIVIQDTGAAINSGTGSELGPWLTVAETR